MKRRESFPPFSISFDGKMIVSNYAACGRQRQKAI